MIEVHILFNMFLNVISSDNIVLDFQVWMPVRPRLQNLTSSLIFKK